MVIIMTHELLRGKTRDENVFQSFHASFLEVNVIIHKRLSGTGHDK
jgi:hypothetical protein